jgi:hypothetical protein
MVSIRISNQGIPPLLAALLRSTIASGLVFAYVRAKGERLLFPRRDVRYLVNRPEKHSEEG